MRDPSLAVSGTSMASFRKLVLIACFVVFFLIVIGGLVRATGSGLGCPDWPTCHGKFIPRWEKHTLIEYSHRLTASVTGLLVLAVAVWAWRSFRRLPAIVLPAAAVLALTIVQAGLGGAAVLNELPPEIVAVHLGMALTILSLLVLLWLTAFTLDRPLPAPSGTRAMGRLALLALATTLALMLAGSYVSGAGYGLACSGWPLCNGDLAPGLGSAAVAVNFLHRFLALALGIELVLLLRRGLREAALDPSAALLSALALLLYLAQALLGAANVWTRLADLVTAGHLAVGTLLWLTLVLLNIRVHRAYDLLPRAWRQRPRTGLVEAAR